MDTNQFKNYLKKPFVKTIVIPVIVGVLFAATFFVMRYYSTPAHLRYPKTDHYHFRAQIIVDGTPIDFSKVAYQVQYDKDVCSDELTDQPIHFHDNTDQMVHIHWGGMTGGEFLKYYGWNFIGGNDDSLGNRYDGGFFSAQSIPIAGDLLPKTPNSVSYFVYSGDSNGYVKKDWNDFINQTHEEFFGQKSRLNVENPLSTFMNYVVPTAQAHGDEDDGHSEDSNDTLSEAELSVINNLIGNVVIFAQDQEPTPEQIQERFDNLVPLTPSSCGG